MDDAETRRIAPAAHRRSADWAERIESPVGDAPGLPGLRPSLPAASRHRSRTFLLADFHVCLADCLGHRVLCGVLRNLTARTTLVASLYQSSHDARQSCADHAQIVGALAARDPEHAAQMMLVHIGDVERALGKSAAALDPIERLRASLSPLAPPLPR